MDSATEEEGGCACISVVEEEIDTESVCLARLEFFRPQSGREEVTVDR